MGNTTFFKKIKYDAKGITWREIFSESFKKHSRDELEHALSAGTVHNRATEHDMLSKWSKPWIWFPAMIIGLVLVAVVIVSYFVTKDFFQTVAMQMMVCAIPAFVVPLVLMIFMWELNIPKNISIFECFFFWIFGGVVSLTLVGFFDLIGQHMPEFLQPPFNEEPSKLIAAIIILAYIKRTRKIYGITGLVVGACVGAGFAAFESMQYAFSIYLNGGSAGDVMNTLFIRVFTAFGGHVVFCSLYTAGLAYSMKNSKFSFDAFFSPMFLGAFCVSFILHMIWDLQGDFCMFIVKQLYANSVDINSASAALRVLMYISMAVLIALFWIIMLIMVNKCLKQVVAVGRYSHDEYLREHMRYAREGGNGSKPAAISAGTLMILALNGPLKGSAWKTSGGRLTIGRSSSSMVRLPQNMSGISRSHCVITGNRGGWMIHDLNSSYGTFVNGHRVASGTAYRINNGDIIQLAGAKNSFRVIIAAI